MYLWLCVSVQYIFHLRENHHPTVRFICANLWCKNVETSISEKPKFSISWAPFNKNNALFTAIFRFFLPQNTLLCIESYCGFVQYHYITQHNTYTQQRRYIQCIHCRLVASRLFSFFPFLLSLIIFSSLLFSVYTLIAVMRNSNDYDCVSLILNHFYCIGFCFCFFFLFRELVLWTWSVIRLKIDSHREFRQGEVLCRNIVIPFKRPIN